MQGLPLRYFIGLRIGMWTVLVLLVASWIARKKFRDFQHWRFLTCIWLVLGVAGLGATLWMQAREARSERVFRSRNFYGVLTVYEHDKATPNRTISCFNTAASRTGCSSLTRCRPPGRSAITARKAASGWASRPCRLGTGASAWWVLAQARWRLRPRRGITCASMKSTPRCSR